MTITGDEHMRAVSRFTRLVLVIVAGACGSSEGTVPVVQVSVPTAGEALYREALALAAASPAISIEEFRTRNPMRSVGRAHNVGLDAFLREFTTTHKGRPCAAARAAWDEARASLGPDSVKVGDARSINPALIQFERVFRCGAEIRRVEMSGRVSESASTSRALAGDPQPYFEAIEDIVEAEPSTPQSFVGQVNAVVGLAELELTGDELSQVYAVASVAVDSYDHWVVQSNLLATADSLENTYGSCLTLADEPNTCFYDQSWRRKQDGATIFRNASAIVLLQGGCYAQTMSPWRVLKWDLAGGIAGAVVGGPAGAAGGALGASIAEAVVQGIDYLVCKYES